MASESESLLIKTISIWVCNVLHAEIRGNTEAELSHMSTICLGSLRGTFRQSWQLQGHAWQSASAEWSSAPVEPLRRCTRPIICLISHLSLIHHPVCTSGMLTGVKHRPAVPRQGHQWAQQNLRLNTVTVRIRFVPRTINTGLHIQIHEHNYRCQSKVTIWKVAIFQFNKVENIKANAAVRVCN